METTAQKILAKPTFNWPDAIKSAHSKNVGCLQGVESELALLIQRATLLHGYVSHRYNTGCGDKGHKDSAKAANRELVRVRAALGFSYPKNTPMGIA